VIKTIVILQRNGYSYTIYSRMVNFMKIITCNIFFFLLFMISTLANGAPADETKPLLLIHFMPWYSAPPVSSSWGWHWTMNHFNPDAVDGNGKRDIASHYYPLTGPYDSMDPDILEYQVLLMKLSGIDGVLVDWYGTGNLWDYPAINQRTLALFDYIDKAGLTFAIVYEDQTLPNLIRQNVISEDEKYVQGKNDMLYLQNTWFQKEAHLKIDDRPVLLNFGPQFFYSSSEWQDLFSVLSTPPLFFTEDNRVAPAAVGAFSWPPMWKSSANGILTQSSLKEYLDQFSKKSAAWEYRISSAFPGFHDIYKEAGVSEGYGFLDADNGSTFQLTLDQALSDNPHIIQLVTWNDYGEGTIIEPTEETGYLYLEMVQKLKKTVVDPTFQPLTRHLRMPLQHFQARKDHRNDRQINATLDQVFELFVEMKLDEAEALLKTITKVDESSEGFQLTECDLDNYPNPFNHNTTITYNVPKPAQVNITIYNATGRKIIELLDETRDSGRHSIEWDASQLSSGIYMYCLKVGDVIRVKKCLLAR